MIKQPVSQKRLTNVAIVRLKSHGKRFEIACYKNKVLNWREGIEKDLNEVIQVETIFTNVSRGEAATEKDLTKAFGTTDLEEICRKVLKSGDLQVSDREREVHLEGLFRDVVQIVVERCVHPQTGRQLTAMTVENALRAIGFSVKPDHTAKKQALKAIEALCAEMPESLARAKMRLRMMCPETAADKIRRHLLDEAAAQIEEEVGDGGAGQRVLTFVCDPSHYRGLDRLATVTHAGEGVSLHVVTATVVREGGDALGGHALAAASSCGEASASSAPAVPAAPSAPSAALEPARAGGAAAAAGAEGEQAGASAAARRKGIRCSACTATFEEAADYRKHCRTEWHNFNLKRKVKAMPLVTEEEFAEISLDEREGLLAVD